MKIADVKIGTEYAHARGDYEYDNGTASRCRVVAETKIKQGWGYSAKEVRGLAVEWLEPDGSVRSTGSVAARTLREEWASYSERWTEIRRTRRANARAAAQARDERAKLLLNIIPALRHVGIPDTIAYVYNDEVTALLEKHVPDIFVLNEEGGRTSRIEAPLASDIGDYVANNRGFTLTAEQILHIAR